jgi:chromosome segregation ATPase
MSSFLNRIITSRKKSPSKAQASTMKNIFKRSLANFRQSRARIHDVAIELSTPRSDTPIDTRHRTATQRTATRRIATQRSATPTDTRHRTASQRTATQITDTQRTATPTETRHRTATQRTATPTDTRHRTATQGTATQRTAAPSMRRQVSQETLDKLNRARSESIALNTLNSKRINTQNEINKINRQIHSLEQRIIGAKKAEKDEYENKITNLKASKLALEKKLAEIKRNLQSTMETIQKENSKKGGTRKRRKYAKKY